MFTYKKRIRPSVMDEVFIQQDLASTPGFLHIAVSRASFQVENLVDGAAIQLVLHGHQVHFEAFTGVHVLEAYAEIPEDLCESRWA